MTHETVKTALLVALTLALFPFVCIALDLIGRAVGAWVGERFFGGHERDGDR